MGSSPESIRFLLQQLQCRPHTIRWSPPHPVVLCRGHNHKLGFHFKTFACGDNSETVSVVVRVKDDCRIIEGLGSLQVGDRILRIGNVDVRHLDKQGVKHVFTQSQEEAVQLQVSAMSRSDPSSQTKRFLSVNSDASGGSVTSSVDSGERPQVKRFQKSNSTENPSPSSPASPSPPSPATAAADVRSRHSSDLSQRGAGGGGGGGVVVVEAPPTRRLQHCPPRGRTACSPRQGYLFHSPPHLSNNSFHPQHIHSLPDRMEGGGGDIVLPDDIVLCEADDGPFSLPSVLTPLPNTPTPSLTQSQGGGGVSVNTVSTGIGGGAVEPLSQSRSLGVEACRAPGCTMQMMCLWHRFVYKFPQYIIWEPVTKTVELHKHDPSASFGFKYKVKKFDGPPAEIFALVVEVAARGVAWNLLLAGDWIRSINGTPVNTPEEAHFGTDFRNVSSLRLVIQRPQRLMQRGVPKLRTLAASLGISVHIPPALGPADNANAAFPASQQRWPHSPSDSVSTYQIPRDMDRAFPGADDAGGRVRVQNSFDPLLDQYPRLAQSPGEHIPLSSLSRSPVLTRSPSASDRCVLPQARVVVCGAHGSAADFVRGLLAESCAGGVDLDPEAPVQSFQLSLQCSSGGVDSGTCMRSQRACLTALVKEWECVPRVGGECSSGASRLRCMNVELYVINDEEFFHHCCPWLLPSASLLVLTFHVNKLLNQPQVETRRLALMTHTLQACAENTSCGASSSSSSSTQILLYGVPSGSQRDISAEEVQVMFYVTDSGSRLLERHGLAVSVAVPTCPGSMAAARQAVFTACESGLSQAPQCVARVVDALSGMCGVKMFGGEVNSLVCRALGGDCDPGMVQCVMGCLVDTGCLLPCGSSSSSSRRPSRESAEQQDCLLPFHAFQALSSLLGKSLLDTHTMDSRQKWFKLISTGRVSRSELTELLASESSPLTIEILEQLGIVYMLQSPSSSSSRGDSGFAEDARGEFAIPYFLQDICGGQEDDEREGFVLRFERPVSWRGYYDVLCNLSALPATEEVRVQGRCRAVVRHNGLRLALHWRRESCSDSLFVAISRPQPGSRGEKRVLQELERLFSFVIPPAVPFRVQAVDSSSPTSHLPSREPHHALYTAPATPVHRPPCVEALQLEETYVKPVVDAEDSSVREGGAYSNLPLTVLPWSVLNQAALFLTVAMPTGHDWKSVAERAGKKMVEICAYEAINSREVPAMSFLREWILTGTVQQFLDILESLDRPDVRDLILDYLKDRKDGR